MRTSYALWAGLGIIAVLAALAAKYYAHFPGDLALEKWVQSVVRQHLKWAVWVSRTAEYPWILLILAVIPALSWVMAGWRGAFLSIVSFVGMWVLGNWLGPVVARPRPSPDLVHVFRPFSGYSFPSLFALRYAATFGFLAVLAMEKTSGLARGLLLITCGTLLLLGWAARVALGAHWPSDVIISYYLGLLWAGFLIRILLPWSSQYLGDSSPGS